MTNRVHVPGLGRLRAVACAMASALLLAAACRPHRVASPGFELRGGPGPAYPEAAPKEWDRLFNSRDVSGLVAQYAEDVISMPFNAPTLHGRAALQAEFERFFLDHDGRHQTIVDEVLIEEGWAVERARYTLTYRNRNAGLEIVETGRHVVCRKRMNGNWLISWEIWNTDTPTATGF